MQWQPVSPPTVEPAAATDAFGARQLDAALVTVARCGGQCVSRTRITIWAMPCGRLWAWLHVSRSGGWQGWRRTRRTPAAR